MLIRFDTNTPLIWYKNQVLSFLSHVLTVRIMALQTITNYTDAVSQNT